MTLLLKLQRLVTLPGGKLAAVVAPIEKLVREALLEHAPLLLWRYRAWRGDGVREEEISLLPAFCDRTKSAADVGASDGWYTYHLLNHAIKVYAFEPQPVLAQKLLREFRTAPVRVERVALSNQAGTANLRVPRKVHQRSTIETENVLEDAGEVEAVEVELCTLDTYRIADLGFLKVDVEGHELAVLQGAEKTLERCRPVVLVEVEERHKVGSVEAVRCFLARLGYRGYFLLDGRLVSIERFDAALHQDPRNLRGAQKLGTYANNFFYLLPEHEAKLGPRL